MAYFILLKDLDSIKMIDIEMKKRNLIYLNIVFLLVLAGVFHFILNRRYVLDLKKQNDVQKELNTKLNNALEKQKKLQKEKDDQQVLLLQSTKMAAMGEMIDNIAHQWKQPLSVITTSASGIKVKKEYQILSEEEESKMLDNIVKTANYLSETIDDFRGFLKDDKIVKNFKLNDVIQKAKFLTSSSLKSHAIEVIEHIEDCQINGVENELLQVFMNLISNSKDAFNQDQEYRYIFINTAIVDNRLKIEFKDNAGGIDNSVAHKIFEQRFTTKGETGGTGIGLYMSKQIIETSFKGTVEVSNDDFEYNKENYRGALFVIYLHVA